jgi:hypothetical protein
MVYTSNYYSGLLLTGNSRIFHMVALADWIKLPNYVQMDTLPSHMDSGATCPTTIGLGPL